MHCLKFKYFKLQVKFEIYTYLFIINIHWYTFRLFFYQLFKKVVSILNLDLYKTIKYQLDPIFYRKTHNIKVNYLIIVFFY